MENIAARFEFRIWAKSLDIQRTQLQMLTEPGSIQTSKETYLISSATHRCNAKVRNDLVDIKVLIAEDRGLEQWQPALKTGFPLESSVIATEIFPRLELETPRLSAQRYYLDQFLQLARRPDIAVVPVSKVRHQFSLGACRAEFSSVTINNHDTFETVAVESLDPDTVLAFIRQLGIEHLGNTSYVRQIKLALANRELL